MAFISSVGVDIEHAVERLHRTGRDHSSPNTCLDIVVLQSIDRSSDEDECQNVPLIKVDASGDRCSPILLRPEDRSSDWAGQPRS